MMPHRSSLSIGPTVPLTVALLGIACVLLAAVLLLRFERTAPAMQATFAVGSDTQDAVASRSASPFGSSAALRNLLY